MLLMLHFITAICVRMCACVSVCVCARACVSAWEREITCVHSYLAFFIKPAKDGHYLLG